MSVELIIPLLSLIYRSMRGFQHFRSSFFLPVGEIIFSFLPLVGQIICSNGPEMSTRCALRLFNNVPWNTSNEWFLCMREAIYRWWTNRRPIMNERQIQKIRNTSGFLFLATTLMGNHCSFRSRQSRAFSNSRFDY